MNKNQVEMKNIISEMKVILERIKSRLDKAENQMSDLEHEVEKNTLSEQNKQKKTEEEKGEFKGGTG